MASEVCIIGYSGHAYVAIDALGKSNFQVTHYCEQEEKSSNPFGLHYLGDENKPNTIQALSEYEYFVGIGDNNLRKKIQLKLTEEIRLPLKAIHPSAIIGDEVMIEAGVLVAGNVTINPLTKIQEGAICNTGSIIEHDCEVGSFAHIAPGAVLLGNVKVGEQTLIGGDSVVNPGIEVGKNSIIGAGSVITKNIPANCKAFGNPAKIIT
jgi:sugar O-acyltransferase (sialic acid O-acetyltransferase NeuD family)